jgi:hypothetical protein
MTWSLIGLIKAHLTHEMSLKISLGNIIMFWVWFCSGTLVGVHFLYYYFSMFYGIPYMSVMLATQPSNKLDASIKLIIRDQSNWSQFINYLLNHNSNLLQFSLPYCWQAIYKDFWNLLPNSKLIASRINTILVWENNTRTQ